MNHQTLIKKIYIKEFVLVISYICGWVPVRRGKTGILGNDCAPIGGNIGGGKRASIGRSWVDVGGGTLAGWGLKQS